MQMVKFKVRYFVGLYFVMELRHMLLLNTNGKSYLGSATAPSDFT